MLHYQIIPVTHYQQNCSLLWCDQTLEAAVVDPGGDVARIQDAIANRGVKVTQILLTHGHLDHVGGTMALAKQLGVPVYGPHKDDIFWLRMLPQQAHMMGFPPADAFEPDRYLDEGEKIAIGKTRLDIFHCPGHTPGHLVFFDPESRLATVGDVLFRGSIGRTDFPAGNYEDLVKAIRTKLWPLGDDVLFIPGHGPMSTFGEERRTNAFVADRNFG